MLKIIYMLKTLSRAHLFTAFSVTLPKQLKAISQITKLKALLHSSVVRADTTIRLSKHHIINFLSICLHSALFDVFPLIFSTLRSAYNYHNHVHYHLHACL